MFSYSQPNYGGGYVYQPYAIRIGVALAMVPMIPIPIYVVMALLSTEGSILQVGTLLFIIHCVFSTLLIIIIVKYIHIFLVSVCSR